MTTANFAFVLGVIFKCVSLYFVIIALFCLKKPAPYLKCKPVHRFAILIAARNEQGVIGDLVHSLLAQDYPRDLFDVYVIPNNCTDQTQSAAEAAGAKIISCSYPVRCKGDVLHQAVDQLLYGAVHYDGFLVFDADNVVDKQFLARINDAFCSGALLAKGRHLAKNPTDSWVAGCYGLYFSTFHLIFNRARANCGLSAKLVGTGFAVHRQVFEELGGWNTKTLAEDAEFSAQCAKLGHRVFWVPDAVTYDEQPNSFSLSLRQRRRWCSGIMDVAQAELPSLWSAWRQAPSLLIIDSMANLIFPFVQALSVIPLLLTLFSMNLVSALMLSAGSLALTYVGTAALGFIASQGERRTLKAILCYPLFMASWLPLQVVSLFRRTTVWKPISHSRSLAAKPAVFFR